MKRILTIFKPLPVWVAVISSKRIKGSTHYLGDKQDFDVLSKGPSSGTKRRNLVIAKVVSRSFDTFAEV